MGRRLEAWLGPQARRINAGTFHGLCLQLLRAEGRRLGLPADFGVCDRHDQLVIVQDCLQAGIRAPETQPQRLLQALSHARNATDPQPQLESAGLLEIYHAYQQRLRSQGLLDFDDLIVLAVELLASFPEVREHYQARHPYLSVDEYQDVNPLQYRFLQLAGGARPNLWAVGDADQAIYAFRGAQVANFLRFEQDFPESRVIRLEQSYRSTPQIVAAAGQVIARNLARLPFTLRTERPAGPLVRAVSLEDEAAEAAWLVREIEERIGGSSHYQHYQGQVTDTVGRRQRSFRDFAVLYRLNALARPLAEALTRAGIPYRVVGGSRLFERKAVQDALAYLRFLRRPEDSLALSRILNTPPRGIGRETQLALSGEVERRGMPLYAVLQAPGPLPAPAARAVGALLRLLQELRAGMAGRCLSTLLTWLIDITGLHGFRIEQDPRHENDFVLLRAFAAQYDDLPLAEALERLLADAALTADADEYDARADAVTLLTLHAAKGLEFTEVFLCALEEDVLPYEGCDVEEERRLFYVGLTRGRECVSLLACRSRFLFGTRQARHASRFLSEFDDALKERITVKDRVRRKDPEPDPQLSLL
jgi:DNA helicase-2/ATP-dependent DNA helicase PcrA